MIRSVKLLFSGDCIEEGVQSLFHCFCPLQFLLRYGIMVPDSEAEQFERM